MTETIADLAAFDGADAVLAAFRRGLRPDPDLTVSEWADRHRWLSSRGAAEPGRYRTDRTPFMREIMDALSPSHPARRVVFMKSAQVGATEAGNNWIGFVIHHAPGPMLAVLPNLDLAKRNSRQRIDPLIEESPALRERVAPARSRDSGNTILSKEFPGGVLVMTGANSAVGLRSMPARYLFLDEVDSFEASVGDEGDPVALAEARSQTFGHRAKIYLASTPLVHGVSRIEAEYEVTDRRRYFVPCPLCGRMQWLRFERLRWEKGRPETAAYRCEGCEGAIAEHHKTEMLAAGEWRATATPRDPRVIGFHVSGLYSPIGWQSWRQIAEKREAAEGSDDLLRAFRNTVLGETWVESGEAPEWRRIYERRERWDPGVVPAGAVLLTAGADVQKDRIEVDVWGWGRGLESWLVDRVVVDGGQQHAETWDALSEVLSRVWTHAGGASLQIARLAIDTGGFEPTSVYAWARRAGDQVAAVKGAPSFDRATPVTGPTYVDASRGGRRMRRGAKLWTVAVSGLKLETYRFLRLDRPTDEDLAAGARFPAGTIHLPEWADAEWCQQLVAEDLVTERDKRGFAKRAWHKRRERNEALDCRVYARAAAWIEQIDRWSEHRWRRRERDLGIRDAARAAEGGAAEAEAPPVDAPRARRRRGGRLGSMLR